MNSRFTYLSVSILLLFLGGLTYNSQAQQADTTRSTFFMHPKHNTFRFHPNRERTAANFVLPQSGVFKEPEEYQYYTPPFKGQYYLDLAVEAYRKEQADKLGLGWLFRFLGYVSPYINNRFEFGVYRIYDLPIIDRENPLFQSYQSKQKRN